ncbi:ABC-F family ATP-binding cassette domain-containing protein [Gardnerella sp. DNF00354]|uniref:ABC-F family ATP-binding cassette domain-containing protein n=2 Tax=Bacteria TaxID=2 RepID=A0ABD4Z8L0_GARVA|nr:ABC-F family ATP-binding cassette domain-containing protein [Gardnerella vaginalis]EGL14284.1 ABC transporter, ATP-binding protein [Gardnerella vaginalis 315-A]MDK6694995.1 ABC-F family ATP-binding cassette domain-containing protein [Gardnerella vaginalis]MDK8327803.1 ABC-F family ATP-binding cassette domain-containing protein [Gardnerella vaginalis]NSX23580.1 ABC-F family ATP-binding cassette domain-containing protein [Gardnerella vaginalis]UQA83902.1 ABC-F family ATP-binding cassette doma
MPTYDLGLERVSLEFATKTIFRNVTQGVFEGDRIGIVGKNGDGKSTLLKLLEGSMDPDSGRVTRRSGLTFGILSQRDPLDDNATVRQAALENRQDYEWAADSKSREIVEALLGGINLEAKVGTLSGGQRRRADLARLLLHDWDILALDEPTNHLDVLTIHWLAEHLLHRWQDGQGALLLVTHDRWFLDEVCSSMWEVHDGAIDPFEGGYSAYMMQRVERERQADVREERRRNLARKELAWLSRGARARSTKQKFHVKQARELIADVPPMRDTLELKRMATSRLGKQVVDLIDVTQIFEDSSNPAGADADIVKSPFSQPTHVGSVTISVEESPEAPLKETCAASQKKISGRMLLDNQTWLIGPGDRFGIVGANGAGKSTLLSIIDGSLHPTKGHVNIGKTVKFAVLSQRLEELEKLGKYKVKEVLSRYKPSYIIDGKEVTPGQLMERLGFKPEQLMTPIADLSGGQKRRMQLLLILLNEPNVLIMDEPGNDLDTDMLAVMEDLLDTWPGTLIVVSHDRYLLERVTDQQFALIDGKIRHLPGGVDEYLKIMEDYERANMQESKAGFESESEMKSESKEGIELDSDQKSETKLSGKAYYDATRRVSAIERKLERLEEEKSEIEQKMASHDPSDFVGLQELNEKLQANQSESSALEEEWLTLSEQI